MKTNRLHRVVPSVADPEHEVHHRYYLQEQYFIYLRHYSFISTFHSFCYFFILSMSSCFLHLHNNSQLSLLIFTVVVVANLVNLHVAM